MRFHHMPLTCLLLAGASGASAQSLAFAPSTHASVTGARGAVTADFNRDGWLDVATANIGRNTVAILLNRGAAGGFLPAREVHVSAGPFDIAAGDLNHDGIPDLAVAAADGRAIDLLTIGTDGYVASREVFGPLEGNPRGVLLADVTRDGLTDLIYSEYSHDRVVFHSANPQGGFNSDAPFPVSPRPQGIVAGDFNHDGLVDVAVASTGSSSLNILYGIGSTSFTRRVVAAGRALHQLTAVDLNADGWVDIAATATTTNVVSIFRGGASGFTLAGTRPTGSSPRGIASGDFNQDGRPDLAVGNRTSGSVTVYTGRSGSVLPDRWGDLASSAGPRAIVSGDFDRDGRLDIAAGGETDARLMLHDNVTTFVPPAFSVADRPLANPSSGSNLTTADFNENGRPDAVIDNTVVLDDGTNVSLFEHCCSVQDLGAADINRDGHADVVVAQRRWDGLAVGLFEGVEIYLGNGRGAFTLSSAVDGFTSIFRMRVGDIDRNGRLDIAAVGNPPGGPKLYLLWQNDVGGWRFETMSMATWAYAFELADVNRDGALDVVTIQGNPGLLSVMRGNGAGRFAPAQEQPLQGYGGLFDVGDLDHDGILDMAMANNATVAVFAGIGDGTFGAPAEFSVSAHPSRAWAGDVHIVDMNLDGHLDVFAANGALLPGRGDGTFGAPIEFEVFTLGGVVADWNVDGLPDVVSPYSLVINERRDVNRPPVAVLPPDSTREYMWQFGEDANEFFSPSSDPDLHRLSFELRDQNGTLVSADGPWIFLRAMPPGTYTFTLTVRDGRGAQAQDRMQVTVTPSPEIVMHSSWAWSEGNWADQVDATAADSHRKFYPNANAPKVNAPSANPTNYVELWFPADPTQTYKLWVRLKAQNNAAGNDSVWVQFSGAANERGAPAYRIGTTEGLAINLEECSGCGLSGWGWEDDGWGARDRNGVLLRFPEGGGQLIRFQVREDGVSIDQIVLSAEKYRTTRPGAAKNDTVILQGNIPP
jgi:hypothetical protein